jgi:hypothetical protein
MDDEGPHFHRGEWAMMGFDMTTKMPAIAPSPFWHQLPVRRRLFLLQVWIDTLTAEQDALLHAGRN